LSLAISVALYDGFGQWVQTKSAILAGLQTRCTFSKARIVHTLADTVAVPVLVLFRIVGANLATEEGSGGAGSIAR